MKYVRYIKSFSPIRLRNLFFDFKFLRLKVPLSNQLLLLYTSDFTRYFFNIHIILRYENRLNATPSEGIFNLVAQKCVKLQFLNFSYFLCFDFRFLRLKVPLSDQLPLWSSNHRHAVLRTLPRCESVSGHNDPELKISFGN